MQVDPTTQPTHCSTHSCPLQSRSPAQLPHSTSLPQPSSTVPHSKLGKHLALLGTQPASCPASPASATPSGLPPLAGAPPALAPPLPPLEPCVVLPPEHAGNPTAQSSNPTAQPRIPEALSDIFLPREPQIVSKRQANPACGRTLRARQFFRIHAATSMTSPIVCRRPTVGLSLALLAPEIRD